MESAKALNVAECVDSRRRDLEQWLKDHCQLSFAALLPVTGDASFRRYFRVNTPDKTYIAMDAPPPQENCRPFVAISHILRAHQVQAPEVFAADVERGYLLLSDFGDITLLKALAPDNADQYYKAALTALADLQSCHAPADYSIPAFDLAWFTKEWAWHKEWCLEKWLGISYQAHESTLNACYDLLVESALTQPQVFMHRDFHSANLMVLSDNSLGVLDFQDAFIGPLTYDVASLLRDCYIDWPHDQVSEWATYYADLLIAKRVLKASDKSDYQRWFDWMGIQRHLKALLTFSRKHVRDQQPQYLQHVPRTLAYIISVSNQYPELKSLHDFYATVVNPAVEKELAS